MRSKISWNLNAQGGPRVLICLTGPFFKTRFLERKTLSDFLEFLKPDKRILKCLI